MGRSLTRKRSRIEAVRASGHSGRAYVLVVGGLLLGAIAWVLWPPASTDSAPADSLVAAPVFTPTVVNAGAAPSAAPDGMVWIPGVEFSNGANDPPYIDEVGLKATPHTRPIQLVN